MLAAGLDWRQIEILRAYRKYRQRIGSRFTESYQNDVLVENAALTAEARALFELRFDPEHERDEAAEEGAARGDPRRRSTRSSRSTTTASCATSSG